MYTNAQYVANPIGEVNSVVLDINGVNTFVPIDTTNGDYNEIMRRVAAGELIIEDAE